MPINHVNLEVANVSGTADFFASFFGFRKIVDKAEGKFVGMIDDNGFKLAINNFEDRIEVDYPSYFHVGFFQTDRAEVDALHEKLVSAGYDPEEQREEHGSYTFYLNVPGGVRIEIGVDEQTYDL